MRQGIMIALVLITLVTAHAQTERLRAEHFNIKKNIALQGYDPVSYFDGKSADGNETVSYTCQDYF